VTEAVAICMKTGYKMIFITMMKMIIITMSYLLLRRKSEARREEGASLRDGVIDLPRAHSLSRVTARRKSMSYLLLRRKSEARREILVVGVRSYGLYVPPHHNNLKKGGINMYGHDDAA
jgi:hypothetical protein